MALQTALDWDELANHRQKFANAGERVGFVPTMGALHAGHMQLVTEAQKQCDRVIVSIFVNPTQFGPNEDFAEYPRQFKEDAALLEAKGVDVLYAPTSKQMYPDGFQTYVTNREMAEVLCGANRPGHFTGVLTVVTKLFNIVQPHAAFFGKKDYQQYRLIHKMVEDLNIPIEIIGIETMREEDGLAMSSRNQRLSAEERAIAPQLYQGLQQMLLAFENQLERSPKTLTELFKKNVDKKAFDIDYIEIRKQSDLALFDEQINEPAFVAVAARLGSVRLIDNIEIG